MLDGILGRGFSAKCKSLMKTTRTRIEVVRRRAEAKQRFLNEDLAKLLSNGLDINAYGRTEEFLAGMDLLWSYNFVEQSCEYVVKQLSKMQKQVECPEECREAVASLMYAAARFSDLPELRELRDAFQQRYGNYLEAFVNQKLVDKLSSRPPPKEKRLQVLQDIASEFSIKWESRGFERRMATSSIVAQVDERKADIVKQRPGLLDEKRRMQSYGEGNTWKTDEGHHQISRNKESTIEYRENSLLKNDGSTSRGNVLTESKHAYPIEKTDAKLNVEITNLSSHGNGIRTPRKGEREEAILREKATVASNCVEILAISKGVEEGSNRLRSCPGSALPPPYVKPNHNVSRPPYVKPKEDKHKLSRDSEVSSLDEHLTDPGSARPHNKPDHHDCGEKSRGNVKELDYQKEKIPLPKPRSIRRKHHKTSSSSHNKVVDALEVNGSSSSRRKDHSRKGLQILFDEEHHVKDDEERMIDKLLIHYSKKPTNGAKLRKKLTGEHPSNEDKGEVIPPHPSRSVSLPHDQSASPESRKVFARSNTFQPDSQARHVHPKLPDYDDLAARFAALKGR